MKVLILHQHFKVPHPGGAVRSYYLAKALIERGVKVVVITTHNEPEYRKKYIEGIEVHYLPVPYDNRFGFNKRVLAFGQFLLQSVKFAGRQKDADVCYAISTPLTTGLAGIFITRWYKIPYIFEVGDLWPEAPVQMGFIRNPVAKRSLYALEKTIYQHATSIVALSVPMRQVIKEKTPGKTIHLLPNMADTDFFKPEEKLLALEEKFRVKGKFVVSYIGALGVANGLKYFLDCASLSQKARLPLNFLLCGDGAMVDELKDYADKLALENLTFIPFRDRDGVREIMNVTDANFISYQPVKILETGSPNKYFDGLAAGKLSIINFGGWIKDEIEEASCGIYVDPGDAEEFVRKIQPFVNDPQLLNRYQQAGRALAETKYSRRRLGEKFFKIVAEINCKTKNEKPQDRLNGSSL